MERVKEDSLLGRSQLDYPLKDLPSLDVNELLVKRGDSTFFMRVGSTALQDFGIFKGDILVVDRALDATNNALVVVYLKKGFMTRKYLEEDGKIKLLAGNDEFKAITVKDVSKFRVFGVVTSVIRQLITV